LVGQHRHTSHGARHDGSCWVKFNFACGDISESLGCVEEEEDILLSISIGSGERLSRIGLDDMTFPDVGESDKKRPGSIHSGVLDANCERLNLRSENSVTK
jgi:hypothetical protein